MAPVLTRFRVTSRGHHRVVYPVLLGSLPDQSACPASPGHRDDNFQFVAGEREWSPLFGSGRVWKRRRLKAQDKLFPLDRVCAKMGVGPLNNSLVLFRCSRRPIVGCELRQVGTNDQGGVATLI